MDISEAAKNSMLLETVENYSIADNTSLENVTDENPNPSQGDNVYRDNEFYRDEDFWKVVTKFPDRFWNTEVCLFGVAVSDWVARIPGLYWKARSQAFRNVPSNQIELRSNRWINYTPIGKSSKVLGGIGTFVLPPDDQGKVIMSVSHSHNASTGIPILIFPKVVKHHKIEQGCVLKLRNVIWRKMSLEWSSKFSSVKAIPRGYLVVDRIEQVEVWTRDAPVEFHPCTIMEYQAEGGTFYDFVFATVDSQYKKWRKEVGEFFENYRVFNNRSGRYLIAANLHDELFDAEYSSSADLLRTESDGRSQLSLITERMLNSFHYKNETIESIMKILPVVFYSKQEMFGLAIELDVAPSQIEAHTAAKMSPKLVELCISQRKLEVLVDKIIGKTNGGKKTSKK